MPIMGIDVEKCSKCSLCVNECPTKNFSMDYTQEKVIFDDLRCILCGHCIGVCPEDAILYKDLEGKALEFKNGQDPSELVSYESIHQLLRAKRSIRQYKREKIPRDKIEKVIESMRYAPTGANMRHMKCLVILDEAKIKLLSDSIINALESGETKDRFIKGRDKGIDPIFYKAPVVLILYSKNPWDTRNSTIAMTYGMISAQTLGLGSCWIGFAHGFLMENPLLCRKITEIQTNVLGVMTLGYPAVNYYRSPPRPPLVVQGFED